MKKKFVIIGLGHIGKIHADIINNNAYSELSAIVDIDEEKKIITEQLKVPFFNNIHKLFKSGLQFDVANICTPNDLHSIQAIKSLNNSVDVVIEKPMGLRKSDCEKIISTSLEKSKNVFVVMQNRYSPPSIWLKDLINNNTLGDIYMVDIQLYWNRNKDYYQKSNWKGTLEQDGGPLFTQFSHFIDLMYWVFGDITNISAKFNNFNHSYTQFEDSGIINFDFVKHNIGLGSINYSTSIWEKNMESSMTIIAEKGSVKVGGQYMDKIKYCNVENYNFPNLEQTNPPNDYGIYKGSAANHTHIIKNVIETCNGHSEIATNAMEGLKIVEIIEKIYNLRK